MKIAIIGATGVVGRKVIKVLEERNFSISKLIAVASDKSLSKTIKFNNQDIKITNIDDAVLMNPDIAIFSAGGSISLKYAPKFAEQGTFVFDNSSAWRMDKTKKLIIPEINADILSKQDKIIANPNCSTIQMLMILAPLHKKYKIKRLIISTYQSITGTGQKAITQYQNERNNIKAEMIYLKEKEKHPYLTDIKYFMLAMYNIVTNKIRSA